MVQNMNKKKALLVFVILVVIIVAIFFGRKIFIANTISKKITELQGIKNHYVKMNTYNDKELSFKSEIWNIGDKIIYKEKDKDNFLDNTYIALYDFIEFDEENKTYYYKEYGEDADGNITLINETSTKATDDNRLDNYEMLLKSIKKDLSNTFKISLKTETIDNQKCYKITKKDGNDSKVYYINKEDGVLVKSITTENDITTTCDFTYTKDSVTEDDFKILENIAE